MDKLEPIQVAKKLRLIVYKINYLASTEEERNRLINEYFIWVDYAEENGIQLEEGIRLFENYRKRTQRLRKRITKIIQSDSLFLTFTFTDQSLASTSQETRQQYVRRFLNTISSNYVANIDFGKTNGREHYHAICTVSEKVDYNAWKYGALNGVKVRKSSNPLALAKYINKFVHHATKESTCKSKIIYSRQN